MSRSGRMGESVAVVEQRWVVWVEREGGVGRQGWGPRLGEMRSFVKQGEKTAGDKDRFLARSVWVGEWCGVTGESSLRSLREEILLKLILKL